MKLLSAVAALCVLAPAVQATPTANQLPLWAKVTAVEFCSNKAQGMDDKTALNAATAAVRPIYGTNAMDDKAMYHLDLALWYGCNSGLTNAL